MIDLQNIKKFSTPVPHGWSVFGNAAEFATLPPTHRDQIFFLDKEATRFIHRFVENAGLLTGGGWDPFGKGNFAQVEECYHLYQEDESRQKLKKWLYRRGIPFSTPVFLLTYHEQAVYTTWKMIVKYSDHIFPFDDTMVFDKTLNWCLFYYHENRMFFGKNNTYDTSEAESEMIALNERKKKYPQFRHPYL